VLDNQIINIRSEVDNWLQSFNEVISQQKNIDESKKILSNLFFEDSHWRDILALTWKIQTVSGKSNVIENLLNKIMEVSAKSFQIDQRRTPPREVIRAGENVIEVILRFKTKFGNCESVVRLCEDQERKGNFKAWSILTALSDLNSSNKKNLEQYQNILEGPNWLDKRNEDRLYKNREPEVIVIGSGQAGLSIAARLKQQNIDTLIVDKNERVGDNWRNRYHSLKLHNQTHVNHLPYMPFPSTWPTYIPKDKLAGWFEYYVESMELNVWTNTKFIGAEYNENKKHWNVKLKLSNGTIKIMKPKHIVMAVGVSSVPNRNKIPGINDYKGKVIHSVDYDSGKHYNGKNVLVYGTGTSAHDVAQDLYVHGANVKIVQRSPSMVVNVEPSAQLPYQLYNEGPNTDDCDLITISSPLEVLKKTHQLLTQKTKKIDKPLLDKLTSVGFKLEYGEENSGWQFKYLTRGGGYYFNVGASDLIADGKIKVIQFSDIVNFLSSGIEMKSGEKFDVDLMVTATGYKGQEYVVEELFGKPVVDKIGPIWGFDDERQELRNMWIQTKQPGLWFHAGSLAQCRIFSKFLALQIKATQEGII
tara:strand:+ start:86 stop:1846 length:1761 start_codon:yes stop_codon:yes gene_type:complete